MNHDTSNLTEDAFSGEQVLEERAFEEIVPRIKELSEGQRVSFRVDLSRTLSGARRILRRIEELGVIDRMRRLPEDIFDVEQVFLLPTISRALAFANSQVSIRQAGSRRLLLPEALASEADVLRRRMRGVLAWYLQQNPEVVTTLSAMGTSNAYLDMAAELRDYAVLYARHAEALGDGTVPFYDPEDVERAWALDRRILEEFGEETDRELQKWLEVRGRVWSLWYHTYTDIADCARFLLRGRKEQREIVGALSLGRKKPRPAVEPEPAPETEPAGEAPSDDDSGFVQAPLPEPGLYPAPEL